MSVKGIVQDEFNFDMIRACGFTNFRVDGDEMHYEDEPRYQDWTNDKTEEIENFSDKFMMGMEDGKVFFFSNIEEVVQKISEAFPGCVIVDVSDQELEDEYALDYDYRRDL